MYLSAFLRQDGYDHAPHRGYIERKKENVICTLLYLGDPLFHWSQIC